MYKRLFQGFGVMFLAVVLLLPIFSMGATFKAQETVGLSVPIKDDLYVAGGQIDIRETVDGDLFSAGGQITVQKDVAEDIVMAGGSIDIEGNVGDDVRVAGGQITIDGNIAGDLIVMGGTVMIKDIIIGGDVYMTGGQVTLNGTIKGSINISSGQFTHNGIVEGDVIFKGGKLDLNGQFFGDAQIASGKIKLGDSALINGDVEYWTKDKEFEFGDAVLGIATYNPELSISIDSKSGGFQWSWGKAIAPIFLSVLPALLILIVVLALIKAMCGGISRKVVKCETWGSFGKKFFIGFIYVVITPIIIVLLTLSLIGLPLAIPLLAIYIFSWAFSLIISALIVAFWINSHYEMKWGFWKFLLVALIVNILLKVLLLVPFIGWLIIILIIMASFGTLLSGGCKKEGC